MVAVIVDSKLTIGFDELSGHAWDRFWAKVEATGDCWIWVGSCDEKGYPLFWHARQMRRAHRISYRAYVGEIPIGMNVHHTCRNTSCVNPRHLELVEHAKH